MLKYIAVAHVADSGEARTNRCSMHARRPWNIHAGQECRLRQTILEAHNVSESSPPEPLLHLAGNASRFKAALAFNGIDGA